MTDIVGKLWGFCHTLRHDGIDYGDYIKRLPAPSRDLIPQRLVNIVKNVPQNIGDSKWGVRQICKSFWNQRAPRDATGRRHGV